MEVYEYEKLFYEYQRTLRENNELRENVLSHRKEIEKSKINYMVKNNGLENEVNQVIFKNNILKSKIKKIKKFMVALSSLIEDSVVEHSHGNGYGKLDDHKR